MMRLLAICLAGSLTAPALAQNSNVQWPDCYCTDREGQRVELGELRCMRVDGRNFTAQCQMSLNNPMWREVDEGCLSSEVEAETPVETSS